MTGLEDFPELMTVFYIGCLTNKDEVVDGDAKVGEEFLFLMLLH